MAASPAQHGIDLAAYAGARAACAAVNMAGVDRAGRVMAALGGAVGRAPWNKARLRRARENIAWCFPEWDERRVARCADSAYRHLFALGAEIALSPRIVARGGWSGRIDVGSLGGTIPALFSDGPCLLVTGHCGNWELLGGWIAGFDLPLAALYRPLDNRWLDRWVRRTRAARGVRLIDKFGAMESLPAIVSDGGALGFIADQNAGERGLFVPFFDRLASTYKSIGLLAMRFEAPIVCGQARRIGGDLEAPSWDARYRIDVLDIIRPDDWVDQPDPLFYITARYRRAIEMMVRAAPEQHLWLHRYWKSRPRHEREGRPFPASLRAKIESLPWMTEPQARRIVSRSEEDARRAATP